MEDSNAIRDAIERSRAREAALQYRVGELIECNPRDLDQAVSMQRSLGWSICCW